MSVLLEVFLTAGFLSSILIEHGNRFEEKDVPGRYGSIQEGIDASQPRDTILLSPGRYQERIRLKPGIKIRSKGDDQIGEWGLLRAEKTILDGGGDNGKKPGVIMAEGCVLDGITVTKVGVYDDEVWIKHHATQGEDLGDHEGARPILIINQCRDNRMAGIVVKDGIAPSWVVGNTAISKEVKEDSFLITPKIDAARFNSVKTAK